MLALVNKTTSSSSAAEFAEFWNLYPRRVGKKDAEKVFRQIRWTPELWEEVKAAILAWSGSEQWQKDGGMFIPYPATWLRGERWSDELAVSISAKPCQWPKCKGSGTQKWGSRDYCETHLGALKRGETP